MEINNSEFNLSVHTYNFPYPYLKMEELISDYFGIWTTWYNVIISKCIYEFSKRLENINELS